jgi:hypothetical protein
MFLTKEEKIVVMLYRIEKERMYTLLGRYDSYEIGENKIRKLKRKIEKLGGDTDLKITIE